MEMRTYEGMFLLDSTHAAQDWENLRKQVLGMLEKRGCEILSAKKWAERKLAYEIKGHKRGTYLLVYFTMAPQNVVILRRDMQLTELVLRNMILVHDKNFHVPEAENSEQEVSVNLKEAETTKKSEKSKKVEDAEDAEEAEDVENVETSSADESASLKKQEPDEAETEGQKTQEEG